MQAARNKTRITPRRWRSSRVQSPKNKRPPKDATTVITKSTPKVLEMEIAVISIMPNVCSAPAIQTNPSAATSHVRKVAVLSVTTVCEGFISGNCLDPNQN